MIYDRIDNIATYVSISEDIRIGLVWLRDADPDIEKGVYELSPRVKAIVSEYTTKDVNENGYEAHRDYIDIQYLLVGEEVLCYSPLEYLKEIKAYRSEIDAGFYVETGERVLDLSLGDGYFAILFPQDGHMPCICAGSAMNVKKVVVKVKISDNQ